MPNIPSIKIGNTTYDVKDQVARDHLVEVGTTNPTSQNMHPDNRLYVKDYGSSADEEAHTYVVPTIDEFNDLKSAVAEHESDIIHLRNYKVNQPLDQSNQPTNGTNGQTLRTKGNGKTEWADVGLPTDEQTANAISAWLVAHPEAVTTVLDGSLEESKFNASLKLKTIKDYVTPEMFGAVGDGDKDDTQAFTDALATGKPVYAENDYYITDTITISGGAHVVVTGKIIYGGTRTKPAVTVTGFYNDVWINMIIDIASYDKTKYDGGWHGWESKDYIGLNLHNLDSSIIFVNRIINFTTGIRIAAINDGNFLNTISGKQIMNCKYAIHILTTGRYGWLNCSTVSGFEINNGARSTDIAAGAASIMQYGIYQEFSSDNAYGCGYYVFDGLVFEETTKDTFTGFYFELLRNTTIKNITSELLDNAIFAHFNIKVTTETAVVSYNQNSYNNNFKKILVMGGNKDTIFSGLPSAIICSLKDVIRYDTDSWTTIFEDHDMYGKALITNNTGGATGTQGILKGYSFTRLNYTGTLSDSKLCKSEDGSIRNNTTEMCIYGASATPISLLIPVNQWETYRIKVHGNGTRATNTMIALKTFASDGTFIEQTTAREKLIAGNFVVPNINNEKIYSPYVYSDKYEFTVLSNNVAYIMVLMYGRLTGIEISGCNVINPIVQRHWGNWDVLNFCDRDKFYSNVKPTSEANDNTAYIGQRIYKVATTGIANEYWELTANGWVSSNS